MSFSVSLESKLEEYRLSGTPSGEMTKCSDLVSGFQLTRFESVSSFNMASESGLGLGSLSFSHLNR